MTLKLSRLAPALLCLALLAGCGGGKKKPTVVAVPVPPEIAKAEPKRPDPKRPSATPSEVRIPDGAKPIYSETGLASWYGPNFHNKRGANGEIFDTNKLTAAHRTLPINSVARVTNTKTGNSTTVRITDRGPFIPGRILDLSKAAALAVDVWRPGIAEVKVEVFEAPKPIEQGGRWCVQIGAFSDVDEAAKLKEKLLRRYSTARVLQFTGPTGDWLRIRVEKDDKELAERVARDTRTPEGAVFLVRLD